MLSDRVAAATAMYVYGYPVVYSLRETAGFAEGNSSLPVSAPWNEFGYAREMLGPETTFMSPNNDTLYVIAAVEVRPGPLVLHVPDTADRYYVLQFVDAWTNNFAYVGRRATGTAGRRVLVADHVQRSALPARRQPDRPLLDRRPHPGPRLRRRRIADDPPAARVARPGAGVELAPDAGGRFRPIMRMYQPRAEVLSGDYRLPAIKKVP
jgi:hypothetical protein